MEKNRIRVVYGKPNMPPTPAQVTTPSLMEGHSLRHRGGSWSAEREAGEREAAQGFCIPGVGEDGRSSCRFPQELSFPVRGQHCHALPRAEASKRDEEGTASARSSASILGDQHVETRPAVGSHGKKPYTIDAVTL